MRIEKLISQQKTWESPQALMVIREMWRLHIKHASKLAFCYLFFHILPWLLTRKEMLASAMQVKGIWLISAEFSLPRAHETFFKFIEFSHNLNLNFPTEIFMKFSSLFSCRALRVIHAVINRQELHQADPHISWRGINSNNSKDQVLKALWQVPQVQSLALLTEEQVGHRAMRQLLSNTDIQHR